MLQKRIKGCCANLCTNTANQLTTPPRRLRGQKGKEMITKIYACYGILGHEKETVYSVTPSDICDEITVEIPEDMRPYVTMTGDIAVFMPPTAIDSFVPYTLEEVLTSTKDGEPAIMSFGYFRALKQIEGGC